MGGDWLHGPYPDYEGFFPMTANIDWCEANYEVTYYVAEFFNCVSSLVMTLWGVVGFAKSMQQGGELRFRVQYFALAFVGIGSALFHGTLLREGQVLDELPMLYGVLAGVYALLEAESPHGRARVPLLTPMLVGGCALITWGYFSFPETALPQHAAFVIAVIYLTYAARRLMSTMRKGRGTVYWMLRTGLFAYALAAVCWLIDKLLCPIWPVQRLYLHAVWHILAGFGSYLFILFTEYHRAYYDNHNPTVQWSLTVPWVKYR